MKVKQRVEATSHLMDDQQRSKTGLQQHTDGVYVFQPDDWSMEVINHGGTTLQEASRANG